MIHKEIQKQFINTVVNLEKMGVLIEDDQKEYPNSTISDVFEYMREIGSLVWKGDNKSTFLIKSLDGFFCVALVRRKICVTPVIFYDPERKYT